MTQCMNCQKAVIVGKVVCSDCVDLIEQQQAEIAALKSDVQGLRANSMIQEQIIKNGGSPIEKDKIVLLILEKLTLQAHGEEAMELLGLAMEDMRHCIDDTGCEACGSKRCKGFDDCEEHFTWQHADRYEALKAGMEKEKKL